MSRDTSLAVRDAESRLQKRHDRIFLCVFGGVISGALVAGSSYLGFRNFSQSISQVIAAERTLEAFTYERRRLDLDRSSMQTPYTSNSIEAQLGLFYNNPSIRGEEREIFDRLISIMQVDLEAMKAKPGYKSASFYKNLGYGIGLVLGVLSPLGGIYASARSDSKFGRERAKLKDNL